MRLLVSGGSGFIGTHLISHLEGPGCDILNLDLASPKLGRHACYWQRIDVTDYRALRRVKDFAPTHVVHLAAKASLDPRDTEEMRRINVGGTEALADFAFEAGALARFVHVSTQFVLEPGVPFDDDRLLRPDTTYGASKAEAERALRHAKYEPLDWIIARPTNIWGPYHPTHPWRIWRFIKLGLYLHPDGPPVRHAYGYVGNLVRQMAILLTAPAERVRHRVFYLTDPVTDAYDVLNAFSLALNGCPLRRLSRAKLRFLARIGDCLKAIGVKAPFFTDRFLRLTTDRLARFETLWDEFGYEPVPFDQAISHTVAWLRHDLPAYYA